MYRFLGLIALVMLLMTPALLVAQENHRWTTLKLGLDATRGLGLEAHRSLSPTVSVFAGCYFDQKDLILDFGSDTTRFSSVLAKEVKEYDRAYQQVSTIIGVNFVQPLKGDRLNIVYSPELGITALGEASQAYQADLARQDLRRSYEPYKSRILLMLGGRLGLQYQLAKRLILSGLAGLSTTRSVSDDHKSIFSNASLLIGYTL